jgi:large subunit ribosomal protein L23
MEMKDILVRPIVTEKSTSHLGSEQTYAFEVGLAANKVQVKRAIEKFYEVSVKDVRTIVVRGKVKRFGRHHSKRSNWKKAYVTLAEGDSINLYQG